MNVPIRAAQEDMSSLADEMSRWMDRVLGRGNYHRYCPQAWAPSVNLYEDDSCYLLAADLAGVDPATVDLRAEKGKLILRGERPSPSPPDCDAWPRDERGPRRLHLMEIDHGPFLRTLSLPASADPDGIEACYRNGFLWVRMAKRNGSP